MAIREQKFVRLGPAWMRRSPKVKGPFMSGHFSWRQMQRWITHLSKHIESDQISFTIVPNWEGSSHGTPQYWFSLTYWGTDDTDIVGRKKKR